MNHPSKQYLDTETGEIISHSDIATPVRKRKTSKMYIGIDTPLWPQCKTEEDMLLFAKAMEPQYLSFYRRPDIAEWALLEAQQKGHLNSNEAVLLKELAQRITAYNRLTITREVLNNIQGVGRPKTTLPSLIKKGAVVIHEEYSVAGSGKGSSRKVSNNTLVIDIHPFYAFRGDSSARDRWLKDWVFTHTKHV